MKDNNREERLMAYWSYFDFLRGRVSGSDFYDAALATAVAANRLKKNSDYPTDEEILKEIEKAKTDLGGRFKYISDADAIGTFKRLFETETIDYEQFIAGSATRYSELMLVPEPVIDLFKERFDENTETVLIAEGEKFAPHLREIIDEFAGREYTITTMRHSYKVIFDEIFDSYENVKVVETSIYEYEFINEQYDLIMALPIFGTRKLADTEEKFICREYEMVAVENLLLHLSPTGRLVILMPPKITFAGGRVKSLREFIMSMYCLEEISDLPAGIFSFTPIKGTLLVISNGTTDDVTVKQYYDEDNQTDAPSKNVKSINIGNESFAMREELEEQDSWNVDMIFAALDEDWEKYMGVRKEKLGEIAEVFRGKNVSRKTENGSVGVVNISNIKDYEIDYDNLEYIEEPERKLVSYILKEGDVLVTARGTATRVAVFHKQLFPCIASSNINVIRPRNDLLDSTYLKVFLDSPLGLRLLQSAQQGAAILNLSYKDMQNLEIPLPEISKQRKIAEEYKKELEIYITTIREADERWQNVLTKLQEEI